MATKTLQINLADIEGLPIGAGNTITGQVWVQYSHEVRTTDGKVIPLNARKYEVVPVDGVVEFDVIPNDDATVVPEAQGFTTRVGWELSYRAGGRPTTVRNYGTDLAILTTDPATVKYTAKTPVQAVPPEFISVDQLVESVDNAEASAAASATSAQSAATSAAAAASLVDAPADVAIATAVNTGGSQTRTALNSTYADLASLPEVLAIKNGVKADGTTDDAPAINALISSLNGLGGGRIKLPVGTIRLNTPIIPKSNVTIEGAGAGRTILRPRQHGFDYATGSMGAMLTNAHFRDFTIDGSDRTGTYKGYHGQYHRRCSWTNLYVTNTGMTGLGPDLLFECYIANVTTENTGLDNDGATPSGNGIGIGSAFAGESFVITGCHAINAKRFGIMVEGGETQTGARIVGNYATACGDAGFGIGAGLGVVVEGNTAYANVGNGFEISNLTLTSAAPSGRAILRGNFAHKNGGDGITYDATAHRAAGGHTQIVGNTCSENTGFGIRTVIDMTLVNSELQVTGFRIDGNNCTQNSKAGISVEAVGVNGSGFVLTGWTINDNILTRNTYSAQPNEIRVSASMKGCTISRNMFYHSSTAAWHKAIHIGYGGATVTLSGCRIENNTSANPANAALTVNASATLDAACVVSGNQPDSGVSTPKTVTTNYTASSADTTIISNGAGTVYLPEPNTVTVGRTYTVKNINATSVNVRTQAGALIDGVSPKALAQWVTFTFMSDGTQWLTV